jgi:hypothetical protein
MIGEEIIVASELIKLTVQLVSNYCNNHKLTPNELITTIYSVHEKLMKSEQIAAIGQPKERISSDQLIPQLSDKTDSIAFIQKDKECCNWNQCKNKATPGLFVRGVPYCPEHYSKVLENKFIEEFNKWDGNVDPSKEFKYSFGRYFDSLLHIDWKYDGLLSANRIRTRTYDYEKIENGFNFSIIRHLNAHTCLRPIQEVKQRWTFNLKDKLLTYEQEDLTQ